MCCESHLCSPNLAGYLRLLIHWKFAERHTESQKRRHCYIGVCLKNAITVCITIMDTPKISLYHPYNVPENIRTRSHHRLSCGRLQNLAFENGLGGVASDSILGYRKGRSSCWEGGTYKEYNTLGSLYSGPSTYGNYNLRVAIKKNTSFHEQGGQYGPPNTGFLVLGSPKMVPLMLPNPDPHDPRYFSTFHSF